MKQTTEAIVDPIGKLSDDSNYKIDENQRSKKRKLMNLHANKLFYQIKKKQAKITNKVFENCQRTARVIILNHLQDSIAGNEGLKQQFREILTQYLRKNNNETSLTPNEVKKTPYFSFNYSKVRIGQKNFESGILFNDSFSEHLHKIFSGGILKTTQKIRKNQKSAVCLELRKQIIGKVIQDYMKKFQNYFTRSAMKQRFAGPKVKAEPADLRTEPSNTEIKIEQPEASCHSLALFYVPWECQYNMALCGYPGTPNFNLPFFY